MTVLDLFCLLIGALVIRFAPWPAMNVVIVVLAVMLLLHYLMGERIPKFGKVAR